MPYLQKKTGFSFQCATSIVINSTTYYKYDIDLRIYTNVLYTSTSSPYRIFTICCFLKAGFFDSLSNDIPYIVDYKIYMCNNQVAGSPFGNIGINISATSIGFPTDNYTLNKISPNGFCLLRTTDFNYISFIAPVLNTYVSCIIKDFIF